MLPIRKARPGRRHVFALCEDCVCVILSGMSAVLKKSTTYGGAVMTLDARGRLVLDAELLKGGGYERQFKAAKRLGAALAKKRKKNDRPDAG